MRGWTSFNVRTLARSFVHQTSIRMTPMHDCNELDTCMIKIAMNKAVSRSCGGGGKTFARLCNPSSCFLGVCVVFLCVVCDDMNDKKTKLSLNHQY